MPLPPNDTMPILPKRSGNIVDDPELIAMNTIMRAIDSLPSQFARDRVRNWLIDKLREES